ncbi:MAG: hypothetical protein WCO51_13605 [bacterium]
MNTELQHVSHAFRTDAGHLLNKATTAFEHSTVKMRTGFQAKIVVDLYMSIECSLKSLMCSTGSAASAEDALRDIFTHGHNLKRLMKSAGSKFLTPDDSKLLRELNKRGVSLRYDLDLFSLVTNELLCTDTVKFKIDPEYVRNITRIAEGLCREAQDSHKAKFPSDPRLMLSSQIENEIRELRKLMIRARKKKTKNCLYCC